MTNPEIPRPRPAQNIRIYMDEEGYRWSCKRCKSMGWNYPTREEIVIRVKKHWEKRHVFKEKART